MMILRYLNVGSITCEWPLAVYNMWRVAMCCAVLYYICRYIDSSYVAVRSLVSIAMHFCFSLYNEQASEFALIWLQMPGSPIHALIATCKERAAAGQCHDMMI